MKIDYQAVYKEVAAQFHGKPEDAPMFALGAATALRVLEKQSKL